MFTTGKVTFPSMFLKGRLFQYASFGMEFVGFDTNGQRVMGICETEYVMLQEIIML